MFVESAFLSACFAKEADVCECKELIDPLCVRLFSLGDSNATTLCSALTWPPCTKGFQTSTGDANVSVIYWESVKCLLQDMSQCRPESNPWTNSNTIFSLSTSLSLSFNLSEHTLCRVNGLHIFLLPLWIILSSSRPSQADVFNREQPGSPSRTYRRNSRATIEPHTLSAALRINSTGTFNSAEETFFSGWRLQSSVEVIGLASPLHSEQRVMCGCCGFSYLMEAKSSPQWKQFTDLIKILNYV